MSNLLALLAALVVGTWNGNWFPSGRAEHRANPDVEEATITAAAKMLAQGLKSVDPCESNDVILCLNEIRGPYEASNLVARIGRQGLQVAVISRYRRRDRFDQQQDVIATTLPVTDATWSRWKSSGRLTPPRGYAVASVMTRQQTTARVYAVHLKSNYGATTDEAVETNRKKRTLAVQQILDAEKRKRGVTSPPVILAGDMNADRWRKEFSEERLFDMIKRAGFSNPLSLLPSFMRGTHPSRRYGDSALDYIFVRGMRTVGLPKIVTNDGLSDHWALFVVLE